MEACTHAQEGILHISEEERDQRVLSEAHLRQAALLLHTRGYVILREAMPLTLAMEARDHFRDIFADCVASKEGDGWYQIARQTKAVFWERNFRWRIFPKLCPPLSDAWITANPLALQVVQHHLGPDIYCKFVSSDTCLKGAVIQSPHRELGSGDQWEPRAYVVNIPMGPCTLDNGPLEVWYTGSHLWRNEVLRRLEFDDDVQDGRNPEAEAHASLFPSRRVELELGDVLIRDPGLLHRGTVNQTDEPRSMLTICFFRKGETHSYGEATYNLDRELWEGLDPLGKALFAHAFPSPDPALMPVPEASPTIEPMITATPASLKSQGFRWPWKRG
ncbi:hypothetical protein BH11VER1_BH11VER1_01700 [soil metagenome]